MLAPLALDHSAAGDPDVDGYLLTVAYDSPGGMDDMINDAAALTDIRQLQGARTPRLRVQRGLAGLVGAGAGTSARIHRAQPALSHACSVLEPHVYSCARTRVFVAGSALLGARGGEYRLARLARSATIDRMVIHRNSLAHDGVVLARAACWQYIDLIEQQLRDWAIV